MISRQSNSPTSRKGSIETRSRNQTVIEFGLDEKTEEDKISMNNINYP